MPVVMEGGIGVIVKMNELKLNLCQYVKCLMIDELKSDGEYCCIEKSVLIRFCFKPLCIRTLAST